MFLILEPHTSALAVDVLCHAGLDKSARACPSKVVECSDVVMYTVSISVKKECDLYVICRHSTGRYTYSIWKGPIYCIYVHTVACRSKYSTSLFC